MSFYDVFLYKFINHTSITSLIHLIIWNFINTVFSLYDVIFHYLCLGIIRISGESFLFSFSVRPTIEMEQD